MTNRSLADISEDIEKLLLEYHQVKSEEDGYKLDSELVTGVEFVCTYEVRVLDDSSTGAYAYSIMGNQNITTTLGLGRRMDMFLDELIISGVETED